MLLEILSCINGWVERCLGEYVGKSVSVCVFKSYDSGKYKPRPCLIKMETWKKSYLNFSYHCLLVEDDFCHGIPEVGMSWKNPWFSLLMSLDTNKDSQQCIFSKKNPVLSY